MLGVSPTVLLVHAMASNAPLFAPGGYHYMPAVFQYSGAVAAAAGFELVRVRFHRPLALADAFAAAKAHITAAGRPLTAFAQCELRSPAPFSEQGFRDFNLVYVGTLKEWGIYKDDVNPVARSNVCPELDKPPVPSMYAFSYTVPAAAGAKPSFVIAGSAESPEGKANYRDHAIRFGDTSPAGLREKARWVLGEMERRMAFVGFDWSAVTATNLYTVHDPHPFIGEELVQRGAMKGGLTWHFTRPPVQGLDYEMDVRGVQRELVI